MISLHAFHRDQRGASAAEFALVIPLIAALVLGLMHLSFVLYSAVAMHQATEATARCLSVSANNPSGATTDCPDSTQVQAYGTSRYVGPGISPQFTVSSSAACTNGLQVSGSGVYNLSMGFVNFPITISAQSCFAHI